MADDLAELRERLNFTVEATKSLEGKIAAFLQSAIIVTERSSSPLANREIWAELQKPPPIALRSEAGMIANEMRSVLDGLACQLAIRNGETTSQVYFPISKSAQIFREDGIKKIRKLSNADQQKIINLNPYLGGNSVLSCLHEIDRTRKHTRLTISAATSKSVRIGGNLIYCAGINTTINGPKINGMHTFSMVVYPDRRAGALETLVPFRIAKDVPRNIPIELDFELVFNEPNEIRNERMINVLNNSAKAIRDIIALF